MAGLTLDTGALIAVDRGDRLGHQWLKAAEVAGGTLTVPTVVLAQAWRGPRNVRLSRFLDVCTIEPLTETIAQRAGELCARARTSDVVDAVVVWSAASRGDFLITSDPRDVTLLASFVRGIREIVVV